MSSLTIKIIQSNIFWEDKKANLEMLQQKSIQTKTEVVIWPEISASPGND